MILEMIKKQARIFYRNPQQLALLIGLPIILIVILGFSLGSLMDGEEIKIDAKVAFITTTDETDEAEQLEKFKKHVVETSVPTIKQESIIQIAEHFLLVNILKTEVFPQLENIVQIVYMNESEKETVLKDDSYAAMIEIPEQFTYDFLSYTLLDEGHIPIMTLYENRGRKIGASVASSVLEALQEQLTMNTFIFARQIDPADFFVTKQFGERTTIEKNNPVTAKQYYTIGMAVMNVLLIAAAISSFAFLEKQSQVFNRIIISNVSRWTYFVGVFMSGTIFAFIQLVIIFSFSWVTFQVTWPIVSFLIITICMAMAVGGLTVLLTAIAYKMNSEAFINFFSSVLFAIMAFVGGSFFPISDTSRLIQKMSNLTPNGAGMTAYLNILRGNSLVEIIPYLAFLLIFTFVLIAIAVFSFPKRGQSE